MPMYDPQTILKVPPPVKKVVYSDPEVENLKLIHLPSGSKTFLWRGRWDGGLRDITFGPLPRVSIFEARKQARNINTLRAGGRPYTEYTPANDRGSKQAANSNIAVDLDASNDLVGFPRVAVHPRGAATRFIVPEADGKTCDWMFDLYMEKEGDLLKSGPEKRRMYKHDLKVVIGHKSIFDVTYDDFADVLAEKYETAPIQSNHLHSLICRWFRWACTHGRKATGMYGQINPTLDLVKLAKPNSKDRFLDEYEIALFLRALQIKPSVMNEPWLLALLTGVRRDEAFAAPFSEFDMEKGEWLIPKERTKTGEELLLPLPPQAIAVVRRAVAEKKENQTLLWPSRGTHIRRRGPDQPEQPRSGFSKAVKGLHVTMEAIGKSDPECPRNFVLKPWSTHDLRRTMSSGMNGLLDEDDNPLIQENIVERILNHKIGGVKGVYNRYAYRKEKKNALALWANYLDKIELKYIERFNRDDAKV